MANTLKLGAGKWATGTDTVLAFNDENNNFKPLPFSFSRASSATVVNQSGLIETVGSGEPRIDFKDNTKGALLLEPSRTNYVPNSENMSAWNRTSLLSVTGGNVGVYGSVNAYNVIPNETSTSHRIWISSLGLSSNNHTFTIYAKENGCKDLFVYCNSNGTDYARWFNLETGVMGSASGGPTSTSMTPVGNGWHKIQISGNTDLVSIEVYLGNGTESISWLPDGTQGALMQFGQLEVGSYATSYIPTSGSAVTRVRDLSDTQNLSHVIGQTEGVIFYDAILVRKSTGTSEDLFELSIDDGSANNAFFINNYNNTLTVLFKSGGSTSFSNNSFNPTEGARYKLGFAYKQNDFALYINGNQIATDSSGTVPSINQITFGNYYNNQFNLANSVKINDFKLYNTRLSNAEIAALTTI